MGKIVDKLIHPTVTPVIRSTAISAAGEVVASGGGGGGVGVLPSAVNDIYASKDGAVYRLSYNNMWQEKDGSRSTEITAASQPIGEIADLQTHQTNKPLTANSDASRIDSALTSNGWEAGLPGNTGTKGLEWDGGTGYNKASPMTHFYLTEFVVDPAGDTPALQYIAQWENAGTTQQMQTSYNKTEDSFMHFAGSNAFNTLDVAGADIEYRVFAVTHSTGSRRIRVNDTTDTSPNPGGFADADELLFGRRRRFADRGHNGRIMAFGWWVGSATAEEEAAVFDWFADIIAGNA